MSGSSSAASEVLSDLPTEQLTEAQLGFVLAVRGLPVGSGDDLVEGEDLRLQVVDLYPPGGLLSPEMMRVPLLHQGLLALLRTNGVTLGGSSDLRNIKRLAATLYPSGADKDFAVSALNRFEERQVQLCLHGDAAVMPGWPSGLDRQPNDAESGRATPQSIQGGASSRPAQFASRPGAQQDVRYSGGAEAIDSQHPSNLPPLSIFGNPALRTGGSAVHSKPAIMTAGGALDSNPAHRVSLRFKDNQAKFSGDAREYLDDFVADYNLAGRDFERAVLQDSAINAKPVAASSGAMDVLYGGQRWYATNPMDKGGYGSGTPSRRFNPLSVMGCFNCDKPNHSAKDCPEPYNGAKQDARRQEYQAKRSAKRASVVQVMYELCGQAVALRDGPPGSVMTGKGKVQPEGEQETLFQALIVGAGLMEGASKRGAEMDEQGFQPRE
ncbi:hypothetical protein I4F81_008112 [Pyropia yezoensis]|uniref:Uncharacterized protein n=1 Tax=Pyropia yezoensis TaxID=2788 RepID=A0ACC3C681_PYRYE|nr:hypothetical protein I4F81_008112 [Neopyropia yezoensis]